jgi:hypothetical protein
VSLARFHGCEVFLTNELCQRFADGQQERFGRSPTSHQLQLQPIAAALAVPRYLSERFVALQELIQRPEFRKRFGRERPAHVLVHKAPEPFAQFASLFGNLVQFTWHRSRLQCIKFVCWNKLGLSQPPQETITVVEPVDRRVDRRRDGIEKIEAERVGDENSGQSLLHDWPPIETGKVPIA